MFVFSVLYFNDSIILEIMAEKKGNTVKLFYDFPTQLSTEVKDGDQWLRVTCRHFRSFNGPRRIMKFDKQNKPFYDDYNGPIFLYETNIKLKDMSKKGYVYPHDVMPKSIVRPGELHYFDDGKIDKSKYIYK
jgi:hypothetical protein